MDVILNVDDYGPGRYARTRVLQQAGYTVFEAGTGKETLALVAAHKPPIILLDVNLPDMSGFEVCKRIRQNPETQAACILHISASNVQVAHQVEGLDSGADCYMVEPIDPSVLVATVRAFLRARQAETALRKSNEELEWFGYRVAHDLNEPLRTIISHTQLLQRSIGDSQLQDVAPSLRFVVDAAQRMHTFVAALLRYAQVIHTSAQTKKVESQAVIARVVTNLDTAIQSSNAKVTHDPLPDVFADSGLDEVFQNLISNAIKYRRGDVSPVIHVSAREEADRWIFSVQDNGIGIEERYREDIFEMFRRLHGQEVAGSGIGLALSKKIVENYGGSIWLESVPGQGSTFYFSIRKDPASKGAVLNGSV